MMILVTAMFLLALVLLALYLYVSGVFTNRRAFQCGFSILLVFFALTIGIGIHAYRIAIPPLAEQYTRMQGFPVVFTVLRLLTPLKMSYDAAKRRAEPYTKIVEELPHMQRETVQALPERLRG